MLINKRLTVLFVICLAVAMLASNTSAVVHHYSISDCTEATNAAFPGNVDISWQAVAWHPDGSYALLVGMRSNNQTGAIAKYDATNGVEVLFPYVNSRLLDISWKPDGSYALIAGSSGVFKYDGTTMTTLSGVSMNTVSWKPDGSYALLGGKFTTYFDTGYGMYRPTVLKYDGATFTDLSEYTMPLNDFAISCLDIAWCPNGSFALLGGGFMGSDFILKYNGTGFRVMSLDKIGVWQIESISFIDNPAVSEFSWINGTYQYVAAGMFTVMTGYSEGFFGGNSAQNISFHDGDWHPTNEDIILVGFDGLIANWNTQNDSYLVIPNSNPNSLNAIAWHPNGEYAILCGESGTILLMSYIRHSPHIYPIADVTVQYPYTVQFYIIAEDLDEDSLIYTTDVNLFDILANGLVTYNPEMSSIGNHTVTIFVSDGVFTANRTMNISIGFSEDYDHDRLPDSWEYYYFGNFLETPDNDTDGDGINNHFEYESGTDPTDPASALLDTDGDGQPDGDQTGSPYIGENPIEWMDRDDDGDNVYDIFDPAPLDPSITGLGGYSKNYTTLIVVIIIVIFAVIGLSLYLVRRKKPPVEK